MKKNISNNFFLTSILIFLIGFTCFNPLRLDISKSKSHDDESSTPSVSDMARVFWENNGTLIHNGSDLKSIKPKICSDGWGGFIVTWTEDRVDSNGYDIYAQSINNDGDPSWGVNGTVICNATNEQSSPQIVSDGQHGAIIAWSDYRSNTDNDIYAQRVNSNGELLWGVNGKVICNATYEQKQFNMIQASSNGGAIIAWRDYRSNTNYDIYAQRILQNGKTWWNDNGTAICTQGDSQEIPKLVSDGGLGAIITWKDERSVGTEDIYAQNINSTGQVEWTGDGMVICNASEQQLSPEIATDGNGGAIITWKDRRHSTDDDLYAQRVNSTGNIEWKTNGIVVSNETGAQKYQKICPDESGGAIITWLDERGSSDDIYAQKINSNGIGQWEDNGTAICTAAGDEGSPKFVSDGSGGATIIWLDQRGSSYDIYAQKINSNGIGQWEDNGTAICTAAGDQGDEDLIDAEIVGWSVFIIWVDEMGSKNDIYGQFLRNDKPPTSNHPGSVITSYNTTETIDWEINDEDWGSGVQYRVWANNTQGNYYVWENWTSWSPNSGFSVEINRTAPGDFNYTLEYHDDLGQYGLSDTVIVTITDAIPTSNHPSPITTTAGGSETIDWRFKDDFGGGNYRVWANDSNNDYYLWRNWTAWTSGTILNVPIDRTAPGIFNYTIEYHDMYGEIGIPDLVYVTITNAVPTADDIGIMDTVPQNSTWAIPWTLYDDFAGGQYRVLVDGTVDSLDKWCSY